MSHHDIDSDYEENTLPKECDTISEGQRAINDLRDTDVIIHIEPKDEGKYVKEMNLLLDMIEQSKKNIELYEPRNNPEYFIIWNVTSLANAMSVVEYMFINERDHKLFEYERENLTNYYNWARDLPVESRPHFINEPVLSIVKGLLEVIQQ